MRTFHLLFILLASCAFASDDAERIPTVEDTALVKDNAHPLPSLPNTLEKIHHVLSTATDAIGYKELFAALTFSTVTSAAAKWAFALTSFAKGAVVVAPYVYAASMLIGALNYMVMRHFATFADRDMAAAFRAYRTKLSELTRWYWRMSRRAPYTGEHAAFLYAQDIPKVRKAANKLVQQAEASAMRFASALQNAANKADYWKAWACMHCYSGVCASKIEEHPVCGVEPEYVTLAAQRWSRVKLQIVRQRNRLIAFLERKAEANAKTPEEKKLYARTEAQKKKDKADETDMREEDMKSQGMKVGDVDATTSVWIVVLLALAILAMLCAYAAHRFWNRPWAICARVIFAIVPACVSLAIVVLWHHAYVSVHWLGVPICALVCFCVWMCGKLRGKAGAKPFNWTDVKIDGWPHAHASGVTPGYNMLGALTLDHSAVINPSRPNSSLAILPAGKCVDCAETQERKARSALAQILSDPDARKTVQSEFALIMTDAIHYNANNEIEWCDHCQTWACNFTK